MWIVSGEKCCANCAFWTGERHIDGILKRIEFDNNSLGSCSKWPAYTHVIGFGRPMCKDDFKQIV